MEYGVRVEDVWGADLRGLVRLCSGSIFYGFIWVGRQVAGDAGGVFRTVQWGEKEVAKGAFGGR